jgi:CheY-like chemotaxis protein
MNICAAGCQKGGMSRILIVDDEPIIRTFLADSLADAGYVVTTARNGAEALDRARVHQSDLVLLDLLMPVMDGITFLRERQSHAHLATVPVVVLSAAGIVPLRQAWQLRATAVLSKPLDLDVLATVIDHVLREWTRAPRTGKGSGHPIGTCPICGDTVYIDLEQTLANPERVKMIRTARLRHVLSHSSVDIADVPLRRKLLDMPVQGRGMLANWLYHELRESWGDQDRCGVHSVDEVLGSAAVHRLWHATVVCALANCRHGP